jgi:regulatory protein SWI5
MQRSLSVNSINLDETITETGITIDDIAIYITGPDPLDQKWVCLFPDCNKRFGRKENVKSHVQTHLGDRQFQCPHCRKCFVRQHDLKRHAKIHSGVKPYPCACGNSFARHDALTRHRQRGMCIGAFEGVVKKVAKRGRPRKNRPDDEKRVEKAKRTRSKNSKGSTKAPTSGFSSEAASSASEYSESSYGMSPSADYDVLDPQPFADFMTPNPFQQQQQQQPNLFLGNVNADLEYSLPASVAVDDCVSPHVIQNDCVSPQAIQNATSPAYSGHSRHDSAGSMERSPPGMCESFPSSSSPGASAYYEIPTGDAEAMFLNAFGEDEGLGMRGLETEGERQAEAELLGLIGGKGFEGFGGDVGDLFGEAGDVWRN